MKKPQEIIEEICPNRPWINGGKTDNMIIRCMDEYLSFQNKELIGIILNLRDALRNASYSVISEFEISQWYSEVIDQANDILNKHNTK